MKQTTGSQDENVYKHAYYDIIIQCTVYTQTYYPLYTPYIYTQFNYINSIQNSLNSLSKT